MDAETHVPATFVMPHYADRPQSVEWLDEAVGGLVAQTEPDWMLVIVDDASPDARARNRLLALSREHAGRVFVVFQERNRGAGACRNTGVRWAEERGSPLVLFNDADDISHPRRLEVVELIMSPRSAVDFIYSPIVVIDECGVDLPRDRLIPALQEILEAHECAPLEGPNAWIRMGTELGYTCVTSTVAARTELATAHPFPTVRFSEDQHTWLRMSAGGTGVAFAELVPTRYRVPQDVQGQSSRDRLGEVCDGIKASVDTAGFGEAMALAIHRGQLGSEHEPLLWERFFLRLAQTMQRAGRDDLAEELAGRARLARKTHRGAAP
jgi:Glycosyl transferase family 2